MKREAKEGGVVCGDGGAEAPRRARHGARAPSVRPAVDTAGYI